ncbi:ROK family protein [Ideonella azotifigens]|uniref:ROK family transcriptional regulator n=2 Tax=Ideonella azotifigens TaxID=513160 RepID=A0ABN1K2K5_9BURK|nr:ROK family protein [Ideonella azotifigens]MCD2343865.1 ROK family protein [Ideonella azotifigens]
MQRWQLSRNETALLDHIFWSSGLSRDALSGQASFSKSRTNAAVAGLLAQGVIETTEEQVATGGRRAQTLRLSRRLGVLISIAMGATGVEVGVLAPDLTLLAHHSEPANVRDGPALLLARIRALMKHLLQQCGAKAADVIAIGIGVPGPVDFGLGQLVNAPLMPEWDGYPIREDLKADFSAPVFVDNDVNVMALGELWRLGRSLPNFLVVKVGTGVGCGIVCHGQVYRGANGSAGDVGHICVDPNGPRCHCGNLGCVETMAAGPAMVRAATEAAEAGKSPPLTKALESGKPLRLQDVALASRAGDAAAHAIVQRSGALIGQMLASVVNFYNPSHVFIGGGIQRIGPLFLAAVRQSVYHRSLALSTRHLEIQYTPLGERAGLIGAAALAMQETLRLPG